MSLSSAVALLNNSFMYPFVNPKPVHTGLELDKVFGSDVVVSLLVFTS
jgi:hypothetical protein